MATVIRSVLRYATPTIVGRARVGRTLTASPGRWTSGTSFHYAWFAGKQTNQPYIDIEVAPGTGVETLDFGGGNGWVRMVPPEGNNLNVKIVGTNLSKSEIDAGRKLVGNDLGDE